MLKELIRQIHWALGVTLGLVLTVMGVTGTITAFDDEILRALDRGVIQVAPRQAHPCRPTPSWRASPPSAPEPSRPC